METVFDHEPTPEELKYLFLSGRSREEHLASNVDQETEYGNIYALYMIRGNREKALEYLNRIRNPRLSCALKQLPSPLIVCAAVDREVGARPSLLHYRIKGRQVGGTLAGPRDHSFARGAADIGAVALAHSREYMFGRGR